MWGNALGFSAAPFTTNRGLSPTGSFIDQFAYFTFYPAVVAALVLVILSILGSYRIMKTSPE